MDVAAQQQQEASEGVAVKSMQVGGEDGGCSVVSGLVPIVSKRDIVLGERLGGRALREWHRAVVHGTDALVSRQRSDDNPPAATRRANLQAYGLLRHPHVVTLLAVTSDGEVITEVCDSDLLPSPAALGEPSGAPVDAEEDAGERRRSISLLRMLAYARDIAQALAWAHSMNVIHRDVKPSHWLVHTTQRTHARTHARTL
jgi:serine/threonine protein kinase